MTTITIPSSLPPRPRRKTAKAAAETISKALDPTEEDVDSGEEYKPSPPPTVSSHPKRRPPHKRLSSTTTSTNAGKKCALSPETTEYLKNWMLSPDHIDHPYPTEEEKADIMKHCGIEMKQLTNWFVNNRKRIWKPKLEELKRRQSSGGAVVSETERAVKKRKTVNAPKVNLPIPKVKMGVHTAKSHENVKAANKKRTCIVGSTIGKQLSPTTIVSTSPSIEGDSDPSITLPPLPSLLEVGVATVTPLVDPMILSNVADVIDDAPLLPMTLASQALESMAPHSCNLVDPVTNKMRPNAQPCALCSACRDWNAGEFCPWDLTGIIGEISDDTSATTTAVTDTTVDFKETGPGSIVSEESEGQNWQSDNTTAFATLDEVLSCDCDKNGTGISSFPSSASFPVPQEDRQDDLTDINDVAWD